jgi:SPP1 family predicted phage head-tail adaptor
MRYDKTIDLLTITYTPDALRQQVETPVARTVFANEFTISATEFFAAGRAGLKPEREVQIRAEDYADETAAEMDGVRYEIVRAQTSGQWVRLMLQRKTGGSVAEAVS